MKSKKLLGILSLFFLFSVPSAFSYYNNCYDDLYNHSVDTKGSLDVVISHGLSESSTQGGSVQTRTNDDE